MIFDNHNKEFSLAYELIANSGTNVFLTGRAGTGKTTFLKYVKDNCEKKKVIVAPTGVAAINAGGVTTNSFCQLYFFYSWDSLVFFLLFIIGATYLKKSFAHTPKSCLSPSFLILQK